MICEIVVILIVGLISLWSFEFWKVYRHLKKIPAPRVWPIIGNAASLGSTSGEKWRSHRKLITPTFHFKILEQFVDVFNSKSNIMIAKLQKEVGNRSVDIYPYVTLCTLDIICETAMGTSVNVQSAKFSTYVNAVKEISSLIEQRLRNIIYQIDFLYSFTKLYQNEMATLKVLHDYTGTVITKRRDQLAANAMKQTGNETDNDVGQKKRTAFLDMLLQSNINGVPLTDQEIREDVDTFMFGGHDTTAAGISYALFCLANNPDVQQRVFEELLIIFGNDTERECTYQDLQDMKYLDQVIKETLRVYSSVPVISRKMTEDVEFDDMILPKGLTISILIYGIHKDPDYYPDPEKFDPDRWGPRTSAGKHPYAFIPFSAGMRNCIGQKYAMLEMKATVSKIIRNFQLKTAVPEHTIEVAAEMVLKAVNGIRIGIEARKY